MGCCGKRRSAPKPPDPPPVPKNFSPPPMPPVVNRGASLTAVLAPMVRAPVPVRKSPDGLNILLITQQGTTQKHSCGSEIVLQHRFSQRLRRYFDVKYCPACKADVGTA